MDKIICYSSSEPQYYAKVLDTPLSKFCFVPLGINRIEGIKPSKGNYIFSTGRSNRDYDFLIDATFGANMKVKIACSGYEYHGTSDTSNVEILQNCYGKEMLHVLADSFCVVIPLKDTHISFGQLVILQAMQLGKPVIVTENDTAKNYIANGKNGFIIRKDRKELLDTLNKLKSDEQLYNSMSANELKDFNSKYSLSGLARNIWEQIK